MANIMSMFRVQNKVTRDGYDLQKSLSFTAKPGELLPVYNRYLMPNSKVRISSKFRTRTAPLNTSAFTRFKEYFDWYFVPIDTLWNKYNNWSVNLKDQLQSASSIVSTSPLTDQHPYFSSGDIHDYIEQIRGVGDGVPALNAFGFERSNLTIKLLDYLGYGDFSEDENLTAIARNVELSPWPLLAYQKIYADHHRNTNWESADPSTFNIDYILGDNDLHIPIHKLNDVYDSQDTMFDLRYANWNKDLFFGLLPNSQFGDTATIDIGSANISINNGSTTDAYPVQLVNGLFAENNVRGELIVQPNGSIIGYENSVPIYNGNFTIPASSVNSLRKALNLSSTGSLQSAFTILALRQAEALQKYKEIRQSNRQDFPSQVDAHYGKRPSNAYSRMSMRIGSYDNVLAINDVDNTNITENSDGSFNSARIAGKVNSLGQSDGSIEFETDVPGILMCIYHCKPLMDYALSRFAPDVLKTRYTDYPIPEFDRTGMQQVPYVWLFNRMPILSPNNNPTPGMVIDPLLGYAPAYIDSKTDIDEVKGAFKNGGLESWVAPITLDYVKNWFRSTTVNGFPGYQFRGLNSTFFKINPSILNPIFATHMDSDVSSDKLWIQCHFKINAVLPLDAQGLPF